MSATQTEGNMNYPGCTMSQTASLFHYNLSIGRIHSLHEFVQQTEMNAHQTFAWQRYDTSFKLWSMLSFFHPDQRFIRAKMDQCMLEMCRWKHDENEGFIALEMFRFLSLECRESVEALRLRANICFHLPNGRWCEAEQMTFHQIHGINAIVRAIDIEYYENDETETARYHELTKDFCVLMSTALFL